MARISEREYSACFQQAEYVFNGIKEKKEAVIYLMKEVKMKKRSAESYINAYLCMRAGQCYKMTINNNATLFYLDHIYSENGKTALKLSLQALQSHLNYYSMQGKGNLVFLQKLHDYFVLDVLNKMNMLECD